jgi:hypothetical protein
VKKKKFGELTIKNGILKRLKVILMQKQFVAMIVG